MNDEQEEEVNDEGNGGRHRLNFDRVSLGFKRVLIRVLQSY
jgi:hypothetical protein